MNSEKTPISILQEMMQQRSIVPHYELLSEYGSRTHKPTFVVRVHADSMTGIGKGSSKKIAKQEAARNFLHRMRLDKVIEIDENKQTNKIGCETISKPRVIYEEPTTSATIAHNIETSSIDISIRKKAVAILKYYTMQLSLPSPVYEEISECGPAHQPVFTYECSIGSYIKQASGRTKIEARDTSALVMYESLKEINFEIPKNDKPIQNTKNPDSLVKVEITNDQTEKSFQTENPTNTSNIETNNNVNGSQDQPTLISCINYGSCIDHFYVLKNYMIAKNITYDDLWKDNVEYDLKTLDKVLNMLGIKYNLTYMKQDMVFIACLLLNIVPAFYLIEIGATVGEATKSVAKNMLLVLKVVMK